MPKEISTKEKAEIVSRLVNEISVLKRNIVINFLEVGKRLNEIQKEKLWASYASHLRNFDEFLKEIKIGRSTAYNLIAIWREFGEIIMSKKLDIQYTDLVKLLPVAKENKEEWLEKAQNLIPEDFQDELNKAKGRISQLDCPHSEIDIYQMQKCKSCGKILSMKKL